MKEYKEIQVALLGLGTVGLGVYKVLQMQKEEMQHKIGTEIKIKKILVRNLEKAAGKIEDASVLTDSWQDTWEFKELIREREDQLAEWFAARAALEDPGLAYLDQVRYETDAERIGAAMAQDQTSFRYRGPSQEGPCPF